jgi:glutathione S-transferase
VLSFIHDSDQEKPKEVLMKLYCHPKSPNATAVLAVAYELGIALDLQEVNLPGGEQRQPAFLKINPNGKVPTLEDGDFVLWESGAIMQYLAAQKPGNSLWPADNRVRADITRWQLWRMGEWGRGAGTLIWENLIKKFFANEDPDPNKIKEGLELFNVGAAVLNSHLQKRDYLVGNNPTLADFSVAVPLVYAVPGRLPIDSYPVIRQWYSRIEKIESWKKSLP